MKKKKIFWSGEKKNLVKHDESKGNKSKSREVTIKRE